MHDPTGVKADPFGWTGACGVCGRRVRYDAYRYEWVHAASVKDLLENPPEPPPPMFECGIGGCKFGADLYSDIEAHEIEAHADLMEWL